MLWQARKLVVIMLVSWINEYTEVSSSPAPVCGCCAADLILHRTAVFA